MRDEDKPFICYRSWKWGVKIVPRGAAGWKAMALWLLAAAPAVALFLAAMAKEPSGGGAVAIVSVFALVMIGWAAAMIRWMLARSEIVDIQELMAIKRRQDAEKRRDRR
jgi:hypothetical protein